MYVYYVFMRVYMYVSRILTDRLFAHISSRTAGAQRSGTHSISIGKPSTLNPNNSNP